jgi:hypothetical protein
MKRLLLVVVLCFAGMRADGDEGWGPYTYQSPVVVQQAPVVQNFQAIQYYAPTVMMAPLVPQYVPVTTYQNVLVERRYCCFFKRIEVLSVLQTLYVPIRY